MRISRFVLIMRRNFDGALVQGTNFSGTLPASVDS